MKKLITCMLLLAMAGTAMSGCSGTPEESQTRNDAPKAVQPVLGKGEESLPYTETWKELGVGTVQVYDFGEIKLHAYQTKDPLSDECFLVESSTELIALEAAGFYENIEEYTAYIQSLGKPLNNALLAYHPSGGEKLGDVRFLVTAGAQAAQEEGGAVRELSDGFVESFGKEVFDGTIPEEVEVIATGSLTLGGVEFLINEGVNGFDVSIPAIHCVFTHMVGADVHNILSSTEAIDALAAQMQGYIDAGYTLILSSHYTPETLEAARIKLAYAEKMKEFAQSCGSKEEFLEAARKEFPGYSGENYLEMTAAGLYS